ncbi:hypothetical protein F5883DRAFT_239692 [Diaporthe sp. PMI_573]|nr:hypothetical protein F5883DRAFT_239692 [Diaporthaceae sp. PMI_573]
MLALLSRGARRRQSLENEMLLMLSLTWLQGAALFDKDARYRLAHHNHQSLACLTASHEEASVADIPYDKGPAAFHKIAIPFKSARNSILTLFNQIINGTQTRLQSIDVNFVNAHGILFMGGNAITSEAKSLKQRKDEINLTIQPSASNSWWDQSGFGVSPPTHYSGLGGWVDY